MAELIVMLTNQDETIPNATSVFLENKDAPVNFWGIKSAPLPANQINQFFETVHKANKFGALESVTYTEREGLDDAKKAADCGCDLFMGTKYFDSINDFCKTHNIKYMPFIGNPSEVPSILTDSWEDILKDARLCFSKGTYGVDFLAYRHIANASEILQKVQEHIPEFKTCIAGSVDSFEKIQEIKKVEADFFTIGSAFFENKFNGTLSEQIQKVVNFLK